MKRWHWVSIGIAIAVLIIVGLGAWEVSSLRSSLYPSAPRMPAVVSEPMPEILARLEAILQTNAPHVLDVLQPGLSAGEIAKLEEQYRVQLPEEIKAIYLWHNGSARTTNYLSGDFIPTHRFVPLEETLSERTAVSAEKTTLLQRAFYRVLAGHRDSWIALFSDRAGDGYWLDPKRNSVDGAVFFNFTETASYVFFPSAKNLMAGIAECYAQNIFFVKPGSSPPQLEEDFEKAQKAWEKFGASRN